MSPQQHSRLSPSSAERWSNCPGSLALCDSCPDYSSKYADDGTLAHKYAAEWLKSGWAPAALTGDMLETVKVYVDYCQTISCGSASSSHIEERICSKTIPDLWGTADFWVSYHERGSLIVEVVDFKYGNGVLVSPSNKQLQCYLRILSDLVEWVREPALYTGLDTVFRATVVQPRRSERILSVDYSVADLCWIDDFEEKDEMKAGLWCQFCPAAHKCPEVSVPLVALGHDGKGGTGELVTSPPDATGFVSPSVEWLLELLEYETSVKAAFKQARQMLLDTIQSGGAVPGYKAVASLGNRQWKLDDEEVIKKLQGMGVGKKKTTEPKLMSPTKLKRLEGLSDKQLERIEQLIERPFRGHKLVPESAAGEAVEFPSAHDTFTEITENGEVPTDR